MNLFKRIGNILMKMAPTRKADKVTEKVIQQPEKLKIEPIRDIEELINETKSPYFSPVKTRNQRITTLSKLKPSTSFASSTVLVQNQNEATEKPIKVAKETKKTKEMKAILKDLKKLPDEDGPLEIVTQKSVLNEPVAEQNKRVAKSKQVKKELPKKAVNTDVAIDITTEPSTSVDIIKKEEPLPLSPVKGKRKSKDAATIPDVKLEKWEPNNWRKILENIRIMRANVPAPVDTMGCDKCADESVDEKTKRFHVLLALMLSSQTKDEVTHDAMKRLTEKSCTPAVIAGMESEKLEALLYPVSFYKNKAKYLKNTSKILIDQYDSDIPNDVKGLVSLPGVGPKMAHICMNAAWDIITGIGVDVHVHRISNRLGWVRQETKQPEQTRKELESWLPSENWKEVNHLLVGFGQTICTPTKPKCGECLNKAICPAAFAIKPKKIKPEKVVKVK